MYFFTGGSAPLQHDDQNHSLDHSTGEIDPPLNRSGGEIDPPLDRSGGEIDPPLDRSGGEIDPPLNRSGDEIDPPLDCSADHLANVDLPIEIKKRNEAARKLHASIRTKAHNRKKKAEKKVIDVEAHEANTTQEQPDCWIEALNLLVSEKRILESEEWLSAPIINASQFLLAKQFERKLHGAGFQDVSGSLTMNFLIEREKFIQILHEPRGHWLTITNIGAKNSEVFVYDSLYSSCSSNVQQQIACLLKEERPNIDLHFVDVHMQSGGSDCGAFAIAYATALCLGELPGKFRFDQTVMRRHLLRCLELQHFTMFPVQSERRQGGRIRSKQTIKLYCQCRMPDIAGEPMIRCNKCKEWFHGKICVAVPQKAWKTNAPWFCPNCI